MDDTTLPNWDIALRNVLKNPELLIEIFRDDNPDEVTAEARIETVKMLIDKLKYFDRDAFANAAKETDLTQLIRIAKSIDGSGAFARAILEKIDELEPAQLGEVLSSTKFEEFLTTIRHLGLKEDVASLVKGVVALKDARFAEAVQNSDLRILLNVVYNKINQQLAKNFAEKLIGLTDPQFAQAVQRTDIDELLEELHRQDNTSFKNAVEDKITDIDEANLAQAVQSTDLNHLAITLLASEKKAKLEGFLEKASGLEPEKLAEAVQSTDIGKLIIRLRDYRFKTLAMSMLETVSNLEVDTLRDALKSTPDGSMKRAAIELSRDDLADLHGAWNPVMPNGFRDAREALNTRRAEVLANSAQYLKGYFKTLNV